MERSVNSTRDRSFLLMQTVLTDIGLPVLAVVVSLCVGGLFILAIGESPLAVYGALLAGTFGSGYGLGQVLFKATPLIFTGLAVAFAFRAGLFNIGAQGQLEIGAFALAAAGLALPSSLPAPLLVVLCLAAGAGGGAMWAAIPGGLKAWLGTHEVINTLMLNFIAAAAINYLLAGSFAVHGTMHTAAVPVSLARLDTWLPLFHGSAANVSVVFALGAALVVYVLLWHTTFGYEVRAVGLSPAAATNAGISVGRITVLAMMLSGALAGLVAANYVLGYKQYYEEGIGGGVGFMGIAVALLGRNHPLGVVLAALLFGALSYGGLVINGMVPKELVDILQAIVIINVVVSSSIFADLLTALRKRRVAHA
jgi:simple sugar transport system permease protein